MQGKKEEKKKAIEKKKYTTKSDTEERIEKEPSFKKDRIQAQPNKTINNSQAMVNSYPQENYQQMPFFGQPPVSPQFPQPNYQQFPAQYQQFPQPNYQPQWQPQYPYPPQNYYMQGGGNMQTGNSGFVNNLLGFGQTLNNTYQATQNKQNQLMYERQTLLDDNKVEEVFKDYEKNLKDDTNADEAKCNKNKESLEEDMKKIKSTFKAEEQNIKTSLNYMVSRVIDTVDDDLQATDDDVVDINETMEKRIKEYKTKIDPKEPDISVPYNHLVQKIGAISGGHTFASISDLRDAVAQYKVWAGKKYSVGVFGRFWYSFRDFIIGKNRHKEYKQLMDIANSVLSELDGLNDMSGKTRTQKLSRIGDLLNQYKYVISHMATDFLIPKKRKDKDGKRVLLKEYDFYRKFRQIIKSKFSMKDDIASLFELCGADIFAEKYMSCKSEAKKKAIRRAAAEKIDFTVFGKDLSEDKKDNLVKLFFETVEDKDKSKADKIFEEMTKIIDSEDLPPEVIARQKEAILKYCGGGITEKMKETISKKLKEKTEFQEQLYCVNVINAKNDKFDALKKRLQNLVHSAIDEFYEYANRNKNFVMKLFAFEQMDDVSFSADLYWEETKRLLTSKLEKTVFTLRKKINESLSEYEKEDQEMAKLKEKINNGLNGLLEEGKPKDGKLLEVEKLKSWENRNLNKEGSALKQELERTVSEFKENFNNVIIPDIVNVNTPRPNTSIIKKMEEDKERGLDVFSKMINQEGVINKEAYDKVFSLMTRGGEKERRFW